MAVASVHKSDPACRPTKHLPGSEAKIKLLARRRRLRLPLFHPGDVTIGHRDALLFKALGGDFVLDCVATEAPPAAPNEAARVKNLEQRTHARRKRSWLERVVRSTDTYRELEAERRREERRRKRAARVSKVG